MRYVAGRNVRWSWSLVVLLGAVRLVEAGPLDPNGFPLSGTGTFPTLPGTYTINTSGIPIITGPGGTIFGQIYSDAPGHTLAVFDFNALAIGSGQAFNASGTMPLVLLSRGDVSIAGTVNVGASGAVGGPGGGGGATPGPGAGSYIFEGGSGGGFGGAGGASGAYFFINPFLPPIPSLAGGYSYGDLTASLQGGSAGGAGAGAGGGAVEIGAVGALIMNGGRILANGASEPVILGGGSGGGIFLHGESVSLSGSLSANGGNGGSGVTNGGPGGGRGGGGGGGGGGRILIEYGSGISFAGADIQASGGVGGGGPYGHPGPGVSGGSFGTLTYGPYGGPFTTVVVPEPPSFVLGAIAAAIAMGFRWAARSRNRFRPSQPGRDPHVA
jgi:hypothetical protein